MTTPAIALQAPDAGPDERTLISRTVAGDRRSARTLYDRHAKRVHRLVFRICGDEELACDLVQDVFVRAFSQLAGFRGDSAFTTWLHRIAVTTALNQMRKVKRIRAHEEAMGDEDVHAAPAREADPDLKVRLHAAIDALSEGLRMTVLLHDLEGYTHAEIGTMLGVAEGTSKARLFEARAKLRVALKDFDDFFND
ncbi:MAG: RNA polymerase sigma factor [Gemmatimonadetes bacterium]|nr:RNA polymerase sigma factor [Gemmatimonadota bacterium]